MIAALSNWDWAKVGLCAGFVLILFDIIGSIGGRDRRGRDRHR